MNEQIKQVYEKASILKVPFEMEGGSSVNETLYTR